MSDANGDVSTSGPSSPSVQHLAKVPKKLRILCLHGYRQNAVYFRERTGGFRSKLKSIAEFHFIDAPYEVTDQQDGTEEDEGVDDRGDQRCWFEYRKDDPDWKHEQWCQMQTSLEQISETLQRDGPFDGILGFSQGANFLATILVKMMNKASLFPISVKFAILIAGWKSPESYPDGTYDIDDLHLSSLPSTLHIYGINDQLVSPERSKVVADYFRTLRDRVMPEQGPDDSLNHVVSEITHEGRHMVPNRRPVMDTVKAWLIAEQLRLRPE